MRKLFTLGLLLVLTALLPSFGFAQQTTVYVVRHAEKDLSNPSEKNPALNAEGLKRATDLLKTLKKEDITAIYSTNYNRTRQTAKPLAEKKGITVQDYAPADFNALAARIKSECAGKAVLVVGHSNTVLKIVEALGGQPPVQELNEEKDYDYLFKVVLDPQGKAETHTSHYGKKARKG
jgi:2,3-bisphosphoglycerate-dependent phosphoglycerate mutase